MSRKGVAFLCILAWQALAPCGLAGPTTAPATQPAVKVETNYNAATDQTVVRLPLGGVSLLYAFEGKTQPGNMQAFAMQPGSNGLIALDWMIETPKGGYTINVDLRGGARVNAAHLKKIMSQAKKVRFRLWGLRSRREGAYTDEQMAAIKEIVNRAMPTDAKQDEPDTALSDTVQPAEPGKR